LQFFQSGKSGYIIICQVIEIEQKETFLSQLQKNQDVKNILLEESPWLLEATTEAEQNSFVR